MFWILLLTIAAYSYCWKAGFVSDDTDEIPNMRVPKFRWNDWLVRGLDRLWFRLFKNNPRGWHLVTLGYHLVTVSLFYSFCTLYFGKDIALVSTLLFAIHPCTNQVAMWPSGRHYALTAWLILGGLILHKWPIAFIPMFLSASLIHPQGAILPLIAWCLRPSWVTLIYIASIVILIPTYLVWIQARLKMNGWPVENTRWKIGRLNMIIKVTTYYLFMAIIPFWLGFYHTKMFGYKQGYDKFNLKVVFGGITLLAIVWLGVWAYKPLPAISSGLLWFFISLGPCLNIIHNNMMFAERYMYIPLLGFCLALAQVLLLIPNTAILVAVIATLYFIRAASYSMAYRDNITLYSVNLKNQPGSAEAHVNLGDQYIKIDRPDLALPVLDMSTKIDPELDIAWFNLGVAKYNMGWIDKAKKDWEKALEINPKYVNARFNLIRLEKRVEELKKQGQWQVLAEAGVK